MVDFLGILSFTTAIASIGLALLIYTRQFEQSTRTENLTTEIHSVVVEQQATKVRLRTEYARDILSLIQYTRHEIQGLKIQIKFLKKLKITQIEEESERRKTFEEHLKQLKNLMINTKIDPQVILHFLMITPKYLLR